MKMKFSILLAVLIIPGSTGSALAAIHEKESSRGGIGLQNVYNKVICVDGFKVFQTIVFGYSEDGGASVSNIQLMEEKDGKVVPVRCSKHGK